MIRFHAVIVAPRGRVKWITSAEAARRLRVGRSRVDALAREDRIPTRQDGDSRTAPRTFKACCVRAQRDREACPVCAGEAEPAEDDCLPPVRLAECPVCGKRAMTRGDPILTLALVCAHARAYLEDA